MKNSIVREVLIVLGVLAVGVGLVSIIAYSQQGSKPAALSIPLLDSGPNERSVGPTDAKVVLEEYSDFECPACSAYEPLVQQILGEFNGKIRFTYRYFPLKNVHKNAEISAWTAQASALQGKFWEMHDLLFKEQVNWTGKSNGSDLMKQYAQQIGLDMNKFAADLNSDEVKAAVNDDTSKGFGAGIRGTPTFFINGKSIDNPGSYDDFKLIIQNAIDAK